MRDSVSVVGLGKLGLPLAACFADTGYRTVGVDLNEELVNAVNDGVSPIVEPKLGRLVARLGGRQLVATVDHGEAIWHSDVTFVLVATPSNPDGSFSNRYVEAALKSLATAFGESKKAYHLFVISSTVRPGSTEGSFIPLLEKYSGRKLNVDFGVCYDPDFVALGNVVDGFLCPDLIVIGESQREAGDQVEAIHRAIVQNEPHLARMSLISAEIAKVSLNAYVTLKISFANTLANICEAIPGADVDAITSAVGADRRVSPYYFRGGLGFGGTCFPRDTKAFIVMAEQYGNDASIIKAGEEVNLFQDRHLTDTVVGLVKEGEEKTVGVLGLAFKPNTPVVAESPSIRLIENLLRQGIKVVVYDPLAMENTKAVLADRVKYASTVEECIAESNVVVVATRDNEYKQAIEGLVLRDHKVLLDCWRTIDPSKLNERFEYVAYGRFRP